MRGMSNQIHLREEKSIYSTPGKNVQLYKVIKPSALPVDTRTVRIQRKFNNESNYASSRPAIPLGLDEKNLVAVKSNLLKPVMSYLVDEEKISRMNLEEELCINSGISPKHARNPSSSNHHEDNSSEDEAHYVQVSSEMYGLFLKCMN